MRHRLQKIDPSAEPGAVRKPIVYYVDRAAPEPVRTALLEGAGWWAEAFAAAGFADAFRVELLPGMDAAQMRQMLAAQGYTRVSEAGAGMLDVVQDRLRLREENRSRLTESLETAFRLGRGKLADVGIARADDGRQFVRRAQHFGSRDDPGQGRAHDQ